MPCNQLSLQPHTFFLWIALFFGPLYLLIIPPFSAPDETSHLARVIGLAQGQVFSSPLIPETYEQDLWYWEKKLVHWDLTKGVQEQKSEPVYGVSDIISGFRPVQQDVPYVESTLIYLIKYSPAPYLPALPFVWIALKMKAPLLAIMYIVRAVLCLSSTLITYYAIRIIPAFSWPMLLVASIPSLAYLRSCVSADSMTMGYIFLYLSLLLRALHTPDRSNFSSTVPLAVLSFMTSLSKGAYIFFPLLYFMMPRDRFSSFRQYSVSLLFVVVLPMLCCTAWLYAGAVLCEKYHIDSLVDTHVNTHDQVMLILHHPFVLLNAILHTISERSFILLYTFFVCFGNLSGLTGLICLVGVIVMCMAAGKEKEGLHISARQSHICMAVLVATFLLTCFFLYATWSPVGFYKVRGLTGRYLIPLVPLLYFILSRWKTRKETLNYHRTILLFCAFSQVLSIADILNVKYQLLL